MHKVDFMVSVHLSLHLSLSPEKMPFTASPLTLFVSASLWMHSRFHIRHPSMECSLSVHLEVCFSWRQLVASCSTSCRHCPGWWRVEVEASRSIVDILCEAFPVCFLEVPPLDVFSFNSLN